jgi:hypothetical protein
MTEDPVAMAPDVNRGQRLLFAVASIVVRLLFLIPAELSDSPKEAIPGTLVLVLLFFFPGYLLMSLLRVSTGALRILLSFVLGMVSVTTAYDISTRLAVGRYFPYLVAVLSCAGIAVFLQQVMRSSALLHWRRQDYGIVIAGAVVALCIAPLYWRSGRLSGDEYVFYGPAGQDPLFHVTLMQHLLHHVPPDNFIVSGLAAPVYHYFDDLAQRNLSQQLFLRRLHLYAVPNARSGAMGPEERIVAGRRAAAQSKLKAFHAKPKR